LDDQAKSVESKNFWDFLKNSLKPKFGLMVEEILLIQGIGKNILKIN